MKTFFNRSALLGMALLFSLTTTTLIAQRDTPKNKGGHPKIKHITKHKKTKGKAKKTKKAAPHSVKLIMQLKGANEWVRSVLFSPDGKTLAVGSYEQINIFDVATRKEIKKIEMKNGYVRTLAFSPDGKVLAAGGYQVVVLWNPETGKEIRKIEHHEAYVSSVMFSKDGKRILSASEDQTVRITNVANGDEIQVISDFRYPVQAAAWSPDEKLIATASGDKDSDIKPGYVKLWDTQTGKAIVVLAGRKDGHEKAATGLAFSANGKRLVSTSEDEKANIYNVVTHKPLGFYSGHDRPVNCALWTKEYYIISGGGGRAKGGNNVKIWDSRDATELATLSGHRGRISSVSLTSDGKTLASGSYDGRVALWDISNVMADPEKTKKYLEEQKQKKKEGKEKKGGGNPGKGIR